MKYVEQAFQVLKEAGVVKNTDDFSTRFLMRNPSYMRMARHIGSETLPVLITLSNRLEQTSTGLKDSAADDASALADELSTLAGLMWQEVHFRSLAQ